MKLMTQAQKNKMIKNHNDQDGSKDFKAVIKLFDPTGSGTWYLSELDPNTNIAFGLCDLGYPELGYVSLDELSNLKVKMGLGIERDLYFTPKTFDELQKVA
jgi:hypothetical protein